MSLEDGHVLGLCLGAIKNRSTSEKTKALNIYERCRRERTEKVVARGNRQQYLYHVHDGEEQQERDRLLGEFAKFNGKGRIEREQYEAAGLSVEMDPLAWRWGGVGSWLLTYVCEEDVERRTKEFESEARFPSLGRSSEESIRAVL
jgi:salicylate hydroxylase